ncbi:MAG: hypothetical protein RL153_1112, partial [Verrucomicrobiota bacterium]
SNLVGAYPFGSTGAGVLSDISGFGRHLTQSGTVTFEKSGAGTVTTRDIHGSAALAVADGTLSFNSVQTFTGNTVINGGTLQLSVDGTDVGLIRGDVTVGAQGRLLLQGINALGFGSGVKVNTIHINGGLVETTAPNDQGWGVAYRMTGGELRATPGTMSRFSMGGGTTITTLASPTTATISGEVRIRDGNPGDVLPIDVADGPASPDLLITAHVQQQNITGGLTKTGAGTLALTGSAAYAGTITISGGTIDVGNGGASGSLGSGNVVNNGSLVVSRSSDITLNNTISGSGSVTKTGAATLTLTAFNSHSGGTFVNGGTLQLSGSESGTGRVRGNVTVTSGARLLISGPNNFGWDTGSKVNTVTINGGLVENAAASGLGYGVMYRMTGGELRSNGGVSGNGAASHYVMGGSGAGITTLASDSVATVSGAIWVREGNASDQVPIDVADGAASPDLLISAAIDQANVAAGGIRKTGAGTLLLSGNNSYLGTTTISAGTLQVGNGGTTGSLGSGNVVNNGSLVFNRSNDFSLGNTISGSGSVTKAGAGTLSLATVHSHSGGTFVNGGTLHLSAGESGTGRIRGDVTVAAGARLLMTAHNTWGWDPGVKVNTVTNTGGLVENTAAGGIGWGITYRMTGGELRSNGGVGVLASHYSMGGGTTITTFASESPATISGVVRLREDNPNNMLPIDVADGAASPDLVFSAAIDQSSNLPNGGITKTGAGTLLLSGNNTFTGGVRVREGSVSVTGSLANNANNVATVESGAVLSIDRHDLFGGAYAAVVLPFVVQAGGVLRGGVNSATGGGFLNALGPVTLNGGTLLSSGSHAIAGTPGYSFLLAGTVTANGGATTSVIDGPGFTLGSGSVNSTTFNVADGSAAVDLLVSGSLGNGPGTTWPTPQASSLVKTGAGAMLLSANNTYTGTTTISGGTLQVGNGGTTGTLGSGNVVNNATLAFNRSDDLAVGNVISGTGGLLKQGAGVLSLTGSNSISGATTISAGTLQVGNGGTSGSLGSGNVVNNASLVFNRSDAFSIANTLSGSGSVTKAGAGTLTLASVHTYAGGTFVNGGTLELSAGGVGAGRIRGDVTVASGARLLLSASNALGSDAGLKVNTVTINGGLVENAAAGGNGWAVAYRMTGGELRSAGTAVSGDASHFPMGGGTTITTLASANTATISGLIRLREGNPNNVLPIDVADGAAATDLLVSAAIDQANVVGGITKTGAGTMALSGISTLTGPTTISAGTLALTGSGSIASASTITVAAGATLDVSGRSSPMSLGASQTLGNSGGTAALRGSLTATSGSLALSFDASTPAFSVEGGTLTLDATATVRVTVSGTALPIGTYKLVSKGTGGSVSGPARMPVAVQGSGIASGMSTFAQVTDGELLLRVTPPVTVTLGNLTQPYNGTARAPSAITDPPGLAVTFTYDGSSSAPVTAGSYAVVANVADASYAGTTNGTLVITKAPATISLGNLNQSYDGSPRRVVAVTDPPGLSWTATYNGSTNAPSNLGFYPVVATISDPNYAGFTNGTLTVKAGNPGARPAATPQPPAYLNLHGFLSDASGNPLGSPNPRNYDLVFRVFSTASGGTSLWTERQVVVVDQGEYDVMLGEGMSHGIEPWPALDAVLSSGSGTARYLEVTVRGLGLGGSDVTLLPRFLLPSQPYAFLARHARTAETLVDSNASPVLRVSGTTVGIGVEQANATLDVGGVLTATDFNSEGNTTVDGDYTAASFEGGGTLPLGCIIIWTGGEPPDGWALCDGRTVNHRRTPDLRSRFVLGQGQGTGLTARSVGQVGGAEATVLTEAHFAAHRHVFDPPGTWADGGGEHQHSYQTHCVGNFWRIMSFGQARDPDFSRTWGANRATGHGAHEHSVSISAQSAAAGGGQAHPNMPPFYVLAYIMRVQ